MLFVGFIVSWKEGEGFDCGFESELFEGELTVILNLNFKLFLLAAFKRHLT
jgi:hypothetical protein